MNKIEHITNFITKLAIDRKWGGQHATVHHPSNKYIQIDLDEFELVRKVLSNKNKTYLQCAKLMNDVINLHLLKSGLDFSGITIKYYDEINGNQILEIEY